MMRDAGCFEEARKIMHDILEKAWKDIEDNLPNNVYRIYIKELAEYGIKRTK